MSLVTQYWITLGVGMLLMLTLGVAGIYHQSTLLILLSFASVYVGSFVIDRIKCPSCGTSILVRTRNVGGRTIQFRTALPVSECSKCGAKLHGRPRVAKS